VDQSYMRRDQSGTTPGLQHTQRPRTTNNKATSVSQKVYEDPHRVSDVPSGLVGQPAPGSCVLLVRMMERMTP
jgi:hypothetical protein